MKTFKQLHIVLFIFVLLLAACDGSTTVDDIIDDVVQEVEEVTGEFT